VAGKSRLIFDACSFSSAEFAGKETVIWRYLPVCEDHSVSAGSSDNEFSEFVSKIFPGAVEFPRLV
jgi:hypothetical protein